MIKTILASGQNQKNLLKINNEGSLFTINVADKNESLLSKTFSNETGSNMAVNAAISGTPVNIWDGTGVGDTGTPDFAFTVTAGSAIENTISMKSGTNGLDVNLPDKEKLTFTGSTDMTTSEALQFYINPQTGWGIGPKLEIELRYLGTRYGNKLDVTTYMADELIGTWKLVNIPLVDFGVPIGLVDEIRLKAKNFAKVFYLDDFQHGAFGGGTGVNPIYLLKPSPLKRYRLKNIIITIVDGSAATGTRQSWDSTNFGNLPALPAGVLYTIKRNWGSEITSFVFTNIINVLAYTENINEMIGVNVTTLNLNLNIDEIALNGDTDDEMKITIRDDLSGLIAFTVVGQGIIKDLKYV